MKLFAYCIASHCRPDYIRMHLDSISPLFKFKEDVSIFVLDNSTPDFASQIGSICNQYQVHMRQKIGASQAENFNQLLKLPKHDFCMLAHDDDIVYINHVENLLDDLRFSRKSKPMLYPQTIYADDNNFSIRFFLKDVKLPVSESIYPWSLPAFPSWIYPMTDTFLAQFSDSFNHKRAGKYSDVLLIDSLTNPAGSISFSTAKAAGMVYVYRRHVSQDSASIDLCNYIKLLFSIQGLTSSLKLILVILDISKKIIYLLLLKLRIVV